MEKLRVLQVEYSCPQGDRIINPYGATSAESSLFKGSYDHAEAVFSILNRLPEEEVDVFFCTPGNLEKALTEIKPHILNASIGGIFNADYLYDFKNRVLMVVSAGNEDVRGESSLAQMKCTTPVAAVDSRGMVKSYSSRGLGRVRFAQVIPDQITYNNAGQMICRRVEGTSIASPLQAYHFGKLYLDYYETFGVFPTTKEALTIAEFYAKDVCSVGYDLESGYGVFTWSNEMSLTLPKNQTESDTLVLTIDSKLLKIDNRIIHMDVAPFIKDARTFVPVRFVAEQLGYRVEWNGHKNEVTIKKGV